MARRKTIRTVVQAAISFAAIAPLVVSETGLKTNQTPWLVTGLGVCAVVTRLMNTEKVEQALQRVAPWLASTPPPPED